MHMLGVGHFYRGTTVPENELQIVYALCETQEPESVQLSNEHSEYKWVSCQECESLLHNGHWLLELINRAEKVSDSPIFFGEICHNAA